MKSLVIKDIDLIDSKEVTAEYLDEEYGHIYNLKYSQGPSRDVYALWTRLHYFVVDLCLYFRTHGIQVREGIIALGEGTTPVTLHLLLSLDPKDEAVVITAFNHSSNIIVFQEYKYKDPSPWYNLIGYNLRFPNGASKLADAMHHVMGFYECRICRYADSMVAYCGKGLEMHKGGCGGRHVAQADTIDRE